MKEPYHVGNSQTLKFPTRKGDVDVLVLYFAFNSKLGRNVKTFLNVNSSISRFKSGNTTVQSSHLNLKFQLCYLTYFRTKDPSNNT